MQKYIKGMTLAILMIFLATMIPSYKVVAEEKSTSSIEESSSEQGTESDGLIVGELVEKREENVKHFMKDDGTFVAMMYNNPVHYKEGSEWKDIDNTLVEKDDTKGIVESKDDILKEATIFSNAFTSEATTKTTEGNDGKNSIEAVEEVKGSAEEQVKSDESVPKEKEILVENKEVKVDSKPTEKTAKDKEINKSKNNKVLENKSNDFKISIAQNINADKLVSINKDKYEVSWNIKSDKNVKVNKKETTDEDVNKLLGLTKEQENKLSKKEKAELENSKKATLIKTTSSVVFEEVKPNINLEYKLISDSIKESIIINKPTDINKFSFNFNMKNLKPELKDNQIILSDKDTGKEIMRMQAPFMVDAKGEQTDRVKLSFDKKGKGYVLTLELDKEWLNSKDRQYPVIVDPSFESSVRSSDIRDTFVASNDTEDKATNMYLRVGNTPQIGATRTFIKFVNLPQLSMGDMIIDAKLSLLKEPSQSGADGQIDVHKVTNDWNNVGLKWATQPAIDWTIKDYQNYANDNWQYWDITDIAKEWYTTGNNYGLCVKKNDERSGHSTYYSSDTSNSIGYPRVYFSYINNSGLQPQWTYHSQSVGRAGTTNINDYNGNVIHVHDDVSTNGNRLPTVIKHVYNSNDRGVDIGFGPGWRLNLSQKVKRMQIGSKWYYQYIDEDGTRRYFEDTGTEMKEEYGGALTLIKNSDGNFTIKDKDNNALLFNNIGDLEEITDSNGNKIDLQYYDGKLKYVVDGAGRTTRLEYSIHNMLQEIYYPDNTKVRFDYYTNIMKWITYADGKQSVYDYDGQNNLTSVTNIDGYKMNYEYYTQSPNRIKKVTEGNTDGTVGASMSYEYSFNSTKFTDNKGNVNYYQFDNAGKTISIRDAAGYAQAYQYGDGTNVNKMTLESKLQKTVNNFIDNGSAENTSRNFAFASGGGGTGGGGFTSSVKYIGNNSLNVYKNDNVGSRYVDQNVWLQKGKTYTFSAYVKTANISNIMGKGAHLVVYYKDKTGTYIPVRSKFLTGNNEWTRLETTFTLPSDSTDNFVIARCELQEESGNAYYDALQLEEGTVANRYNLIENADMSGGAKIPDYWYDTMNGGATTSEASDTRLTIDDSNHPPYLDGHVFKLTGRQGKDTRIHQEIKISGKAGDTFVVSGWAKGAAVPHGTFAIQPAFIIPGGAQWETISFNRDSKNWQYANGVIKAKSDFSEIHLYLTYSNNANEVMFDGIQVYKEEFGETYQYDSKGNLVSAVDLNKQNSKFEYNGNNNLIQATDPKGNKFTYQYDGKNNIIEAKTSTNTVYSFQYDKYGNPITSRVGDKLTFIQSSATYTDDGNFISELKDAEGNTTKYNYDKTKGTLTNSTDANGKVTSYSYDIFNRLLDVSKTAGGVVHKNSYTYENDRLKSITHNNDQVKYNFTYDSLGNTDKVSVGSQTLIDNDYDNSTGNLTKSTYGNGNIISSDYDNIGRATNKKSNGTPYAEYSYDNSGNLALLNDITNNVKYRYVYDGADRLTKTTDSNNNELSYEYDANNNTNKVIEKISGRSYATSYKHDSDNRPTEVLFNSLKTVNKYDSLGRIDYKEFGTVAADGTFSSKYKTDIEYKNIANQDNVSVAYQGHIENSGWIAAVKEGETCGTTGQNLRLEGIKINLVNKPAGASIKYQAHIENSGWLGWVNEGQLGGTESKGLRLEGIKIQLVNMPGYKVQYRAHVTNVGWQNWVSDGELAGTESQGIKMEALQIRIVNMNQVSTTTNKIASIDNGGNKIEYTYDKTGNIATVKQASKTTSYQYNELNELVREDNQALGKTIIYNYDAGGNITSKREYDYTTGTPGTVTNTVAYAYGDANWKDKLTSYNGSNISYDSIGNPLTYSGYTYTWERGRQLKGISGNSKNISYKYNDSGIRTEKTVNGVLTKYHLVGDKVTYEESGNDKIYYTYDASGNLVSMNLGGGNSSELYEEVGSHTPVQLSGTNSAAEKFKATDLFDKISVNCPSWSNNIGNLTLSLYKWNTDYNTTISASPVVKKEFVNFTDNQWLEISFATQTSGEYLWVLNNPTETVGVYKYENSTNSNTAYLNGAVTSGDYISKISYKTDEYYYIRNLQGDIIGLIDKTGTQVVTYNYDSWGKLISIEGSLKDSVGVKNPYRYRGYRYDNETGMYYLQSRYYNPEWGRFINADGLIGQTGELLVHNMFSYCKNNPINRQDTNGYRDEPTSGGGGGGGGILFLLLRMGDKVSQKVSELEEALAEKLSIKALERASKLTEKVAEKGSKGLRIPNAETLKMSQTVQNHMNDIIKRGINRGELSRPYIDSNGTTLLTKEIMNSGIPEKDISLANGLRWDVAGTFRGSTGNWELVVNLDTNTVVHFNFVTK